MNVGRIQFNHEDKTLILCLPDLPLGILYLRLLIRKLSRRTWTSSGTLHGVACVNRLLSSPAPIIGSDISSVLCVSPKKTSGFPGGQVTHTLVAYRQDPP